MDILSTISRLPGYAAVSMIRLYQKTLSFDHGLLKFFFPFGRCKFRPTCSEYAMQAINEYGFLKGGFKACWRILRCNPWSKGGYDPVKRIKDRELRIKG